MPNEIAFYHILIGFETTTGPNKTSLSDLQICNFSNSVLYSGLRRIPFRKSVFCVFERSFMLCCTVIFFISVSMSSEEEIFQCAQCLLYNHYLFTRNLLLYMNCTENRDKEDALTIILNMEDNISVGY